MCRGDIHRFNKKTFGELTQNFLDVEKRISLRELHVPGIHFDTSRPQEHAKRFSRGNGGSGGGSGGGGGVIVVPGHPAYAPYRNSPRYYHDVIEHPPKRTRRPLSPGQPDDVYDEDCYHHHPPPPYTVVVHELVGTYPPYYADNVCARRAQYPLGTHPAWYEQPPLPPPPPPGWWGPYSIEAFYRRPPGFPPCQDARNISETVGNVERTASPPANQCNAQRDADAAAEHAINETFLVTRLLQMIESLPHLKLSPRQLHRITQLRDLTNHERVHAPRPHAQAQLPPLLPRTSPGRRRTCAS